MLPKHLLAKFSAALQAVGIDGSQRLAVALSGGSDSLALACLTSWWGRQQAGPAEEGKHLALVIDHRLRGQESRAEAAQALRNAEQLGLQAVLLNLDMGPVEHGKLMAAARQERHAAMEAACVEAGVKHLLMGHHQGDQVEGFLIRLTRGSGLSGLQCMRPLSRQLDSSVADVRPLLGFSKEELREVCSAAGLAWAEDPTNTDRSFVRNAVRELLARESASGGQERPTIPSDVVRLLEACRRAEEAVRPGLEALRQQAVERREGRDGLCLAVQVRPLVSAPAHLGHRLLGEVMQEARGGAYPCSSKAVDSVLAHLQEGRLRKRLVYGKCHFVAQKESSGAVMLVTALDQGSKDPALGRGKEDSEFWAVSEG